jgi:hypothetical protein
MVSGDVQAMSLFELAGAFEPKPLVNQIFLVAGVLVWLRFS